MAIAFPLFCADAGNLVQPRHAARVWHSVHPVTRSLLGCGFGGAPGSLA